MSHFTRIKTEMVNRLYLTQALEDLDCHVEVGEAEIRGYRGNRTKVDLKVPTQYGGYDIGFRKKDNSYEMVADWWGIHGMKPKQFLADVTQRYAYRATRAKLEEQGFNLVEENIQEGNRIHLVLRRVA
ncbi:MAG: hypothetical protein B6242_01235 [Anaerolineaceae bacterium 4572_78]|nr:MAG: hypothetical protein B6242_01235 [Anaerolineaceae bacterium 4572_78]